MKQKLNKKNKYKGEQRSTSIEEFKWNGKRKKEYSLKEWIKRN